MKILYVADTFLPKKDGVVRYMMETAKRFSKDVELEFLVPEFKGAKEIAETLPWKTHFCKPGRFKISDYPSTIPRKKNITAQLEWADIICAHAMGPLVATTTMHAKKLGKKVIEVVHSLDWELLAYATRIPHRAIALLKPIAKFLYNRVDCLVVADKIIGVELRKIGVDKPIEINSLGVDPTKFNPDRLKRVQMRRKLKLEDKFVIAFLGRLSREKNVHMLAKTFDLIRKKIPNAELLFIGDGPERKKVTREGVIISGWVENPEDYLRAADLFVLPSATETTALALMEAMACGLPVVASAVGSIPSYVEPDENGILVDKDSLSVAMLASIIYDLHLKFRKRYAMGERASEVIGNNYSWDKTAARLEKLLKEHYAEE